MYNVSNERLAKERLARAVKYGVENIKFGGSEIDALINALKAAQSDAFKAKRSANLLPDEAGIDQWSEWSE